MIQDAIGYVVAGVWMVATILMLKRSGGGEASAMHYRLLAFALIVVGVIASAVLQKLHLDELLALIVDLPSSLNTAVAGVIAGYGYMRSKGDDK